MNKSFAADLKREIRHLELELKNAELPSRKQQIEDLIAKADALLLKVIWSNQENMNKLNHDRTLASLRTEASYARWEKRHVGDGQGKSARIASKAYNKASRKASKLQLKKVGA